MYKKNKGAYMVIPFYSLFQMGSLCIFRWHIVHTKSLINMFSSVRILPYFSKGDDGPRKANWVGEDDDSKQKKQIKVKQFSFQAIASFLFSRTMNRIQFLFNEDLFLKIKRFRILLDQEDQFLIRLIKILQTSNYQDHLIVQIEFVL